MPISFKGTATYKNRLRKYRKGTRGTRKGRKSVKVSSSVKNYVKTTLHKQVENKKYIGYTQRADISTPQGSVNLMPILSQGTTGATRVGNQIRVMNAKISLIVRLLPYNATTNTKPCPVWIRWYILKQRLTNASTFSSTDFFQVNGASTSFQGTTLDLILPINKDIVNVYRSGTFKLGAGAQNPTLYPQANCVFDNAPYTKFLTIPYGKYMNKILKYDDSFTNCQNANMWFVIQSVNADGSAFSGSSAQMDLVYQVEYEDA